MKMNRGDKRSKGIFEYIRRYTNKRGFPPTLSEIAASQGYKSNSGVIRHLDKLEKWGWISRHHGKSRSIRILRKCEPEGPDASSENIPEGPNASSENLFRR